MYLSITTPDLTGELFDNALDKLAAPETDEFTKESVFDLIRILTQYTDEQRIKTLFKKSVPLFADMKHQKEQKKAYRFD